MVSIGGGGSDASRFSLPLLKVQPGQCIEFELASTEPLSIGVHWCDRSLVCVGDGCPLCDYSQCRSAVFAVVTQMVNGKPGREALLEMSASAYARLDGLLRMEGVRWAPTLLCQATRRKRNSPLVVEPRATGPRAIGSGSPPIRTLRAVCVLMKLAQPQAAESPSEWMLRMRPTFLAHAKREADRLA